MLLRDWHKLQRVLSRGKVTTSVLKLQIPRLNYRRYLNAALSRAGIAHARAAAELWRSMSGSCHSTLTFLQLISATLGSSTIHREVPLSKCSSCEPPPDPLTCLTDRQSARQNRRYVPLTTN